MKFTFLSEKHAEQFIEKCMDFCAENGYLSLFTAKEFVRDVSCLYLDRGRLEDKQIGWGPETFKATAEVIDTDGMTEVTMPEPHAVTAALLKKEEAHNNVNHPNHYQSEGGLETIDVINEFTKGLDGVEAFAIGNALKYICRFDKKNGVEDLKKAQWYLDYVVRYRESGRKNHDAMVDSIVGLMNVKLDKDGYLDIGEGAENELGISREMFEEALEKLNDSGHAYISGKIIPSVTDPGKLMTVSIICPIVWDPFIRAAVNNTLMIYGGDMDGDFVFYGGKAYYASVNDGLVVRRGDIPNRPMNYTGRFVQDTEETTT